MVSSKAAIFLSHVQFMPKVGDDCCDDNVGNPEVDAPHSWRSMPATVTPCRPRPDVFSVIGRMPDRRRIFAEFCFCWLPAKGCAKNRECLLPN